MLGARIFPVNFLRQIVRGALFLWLSRPSCTHFSPKSAVFPCIFPVNREIWARLARSRLRAQPVPSSEISDTSGALDSVDFSEGYVVRSDLQTVAMVHSGRKYTYNLGWPFSRYEFGLGVLKSRDQCALFSPACWDGVTQTPVRCKSEGLRSV